jgi:hypothetical protein
MKAEEIEEAWKGYDEERQHAQVEVGPARHAFFAGAELAAPRLDALEKALWGMKRGSCWCEAGIGNPMYGGHTDSCKAARQLLEGTE